MINQSIGLHAYTAAQSTFLVHQIILSLKICSLGKFSVSSTFEELSKFIFQNNHGSDKNLSCSCSRSLFPFDIFGLVQSPATRCFWLPWVADAACCCMLKDRGTERIHFSFLRKQRRSIPASRVSVASEAAEVGASLKSVLKLFLGVLLAGNLDQVPRLTTWERRLIGHTANTTTAAGIDARDTRFRLQSVWKRRTKLKQAQEVATRHETEE